MVTFDYDYYDPSMDFDISISYVLRHVKKFSLFSKFNFFIRRWL